MDIGKLDKEDWNLKSIEDKLITKKKSGDGGAGEELDKSGSKVPKWSKAAFQDKFNIMRTKLTTGHDGSQGTNVHTKEMPFLWVLDIRLRITK